MEVEICHCFMDTNTFLHYRSFTEVDWCQELEAKHVTLVVCSTVLRELDQKKLSDSDSKIRDRARRIISKLAEIASANKQVEIRPNVELLFLTKEPRIAWDLEGLSPDLPDDRVVATVLCETASKDNVVLVTADLGLRLKAESKGIRYHSLSDKLRLKPGRSSEQKELIKLRERLSHLENRLAILSIKLVSEDGIGNIGRFCLQRTPAMSSTDVDTRLSEIRKKLQYSPPDTEKIGSLASALSGYAWPSHEEVDRYRHDVDKYIDQMREYLKKEWKYRELRSRTIELRFVVVNEGTAPAKDIDVFLYFPNGFEVCDADNLSSEPTSPGEPVPPRTLTEMLVDWTRIKVPYLPRVSSTTVSPQFRADVSRGPCIRKTDSYEVMFSVPKLKHGLQIEFDPVYTIFASIESGQSFNVNYSVLVGNLPEEIKGQVHVIVNTEGLG